MPPAGGIFPPLHNALHIGNEGYSPALLRKISWAGGNFQSFARAQEALAELADISIQKRQVARITNRVGRELLSLRNREGWRSSPDVPAGETAAVVAFDGGRVQLRMEGEGPGVHGPHWEETKVAQCQLLEAPTLAEDPHPEVPACFVDPGHVRAMVTALKGSGKPVSSAEEKDLKPSPEKQASQSKKRPKVLFKSCVASIHDTEAFMPILKNEARLLPLENATKKCFVGDGASSNWAIHEALFPQWTPILDFVHLVEHLYTAAISVEKVPKKAWHLYLSLVTDAWQGKPQAIISTLLDYQKEIGLPPPKSDERDPRCILNRALKYIQANEKRMDYPTLRRLSLPITSGQIESLIKQVNMRVKGSDKFWNNTNLEALLQIRAATLSTTAIWDSYWNKKWELAKELDNIFMRKAA